jgi:hypothetical protein
MGEYYYSHEDRKNQLHNLRAALKQLIAYLQATNRFVDRIPDYASALVETERLLSQDFKQEDLSSLSRGIPDLIYRHKEWIPPLEKDSSGQWLEPPWFTELESYLQPVLNAAAILRFIGYR